MTTRRELLRREPSAFGFLALLREFERSHPEKPRIGRNRTLAEEVVTTGQDPLMTFPDAEITGYTERQGRSPEVRTRFLGYFGPQGALPANTTQEVYHWFIGRNDSFVRFADLFATRFQQLFFRVWSDARAITQFDHPEDDRFQAYLGALIGLPEPGAIGRDSLSAHDRLRLVGLAAGRVKSPVRLRQMLETLLGVGIAIDEHVPMWLVFEPDDRSRLGVAGSGLGRDLRLGARAQSATDRIRIRVFCATLAQYRRFLPGGDGFARLSDAVWWYLGPAIDVQVMPFLPAREVPRARIGSSGDGLQLGYTGWIGPPGTGDGGADAFIGSAVFATVPTAPAA